MSTLAGYVYVMAPDGNVVGLGPADSVPDWAMAQITNPKAWVGGVVPGEPEPPQSPSGLDGGSSGPSVPPPVEVKVPPRGGAGSSRDAWAAYAAAHGVEVTEQMKTREDIITALVAAEIPVE